MHHYSVRLLTVTPSVNELKLIILQFMYIYDRLIKDSVLNLIIIHCFRFIILLFSLCFLFYILQINVLRLTFETLL